VNQTASPLTAENPFSTRRTRPGAMPFIFPAGQDAETLIARLRDNDWRGEILGPHGAGKSALLATLIPAVERAGRRPILIELHDGQRRLPPISSEAIGPTMLLIVDGCEQLGRWRRWRLKRLCCRRGCGLLVTAHASVGLPQLCRNSVTPEVAEAVVRRLLAGRPPAITVAEVADCLVRRGGNLRETLFDLYDLFEQRRPAAGQNLT
jgi:hypothetical protein